jgi:hypothetical protein
MAKENQKPQGAPATVLPMSTACCVEKCTSKVEKMSFCKVHYMWFKEGLVNKQGQKPTDFDKKYQAFMLRNKTAA